MSPRFCTQCGAPLPADARFCARCGRPVAGGGPPPPRRRFPADRWAPALVAGAVLAVGAIAVLIGSLNAAAPNVPPPRGGGQSAGLPEGHPPLKLPADVLDAITKLADAARQNPGDLQTWQQLGFVQYRAGQVDPAYLAQAAATYGHILERDPENLDALRALGNIAFDRNQPEQAMQYYARYLKEKPDDLGVRTDYGTMQLTAGQTAAATKTYEEVLAADPKYFQAQFNLAIAYRAGGDDEAAMKALARAREVAGDDATRQRVDELLAHLRGGPPPASAETAPPGDAGSERPMETIVE